MFLHVWVCAWTHTPVLHIPASHVFWDCFLVLRLVHVDMSAYAHMSACILDVFARVYAFVYICVCIHVGHVCMCLRVCVWTCIYGYLCVCMYMAGGGRGCRCLSMHTASGCMLDEARKGPAHGEITWLGLRLQAHWQGGGPGTSDTRHPWLYPFSGAPLGSWLSC